MSKSAAIEQHRKEKRVVRYATHMRDAETGEVAISDVREMATSNEQAEARDIVALLAKSYRDTVEFCKAHGETPEQAHSYAEATDERRAYARGKSARDLTWFDISMIADVDINEALEMWQRVRLAAMDEQDSGARGARTVHAASPFERARYVVIRDSFMAGWKPQNGIETAMLEMMADTYSQFQYWMEIGHERVISRHDEQRKDVSRFEVGGWKSPYQSEADAVEQAHVMADRYNRIFLRTLRQLRDLRRYAPPIIVNNGGQVNVAGQQVNVNKQGS